MKDIFLDANGSNPLSEIKHESALDVAPLKIKTVHDGREQFDRWDTSM